MNTFHVLPPRICVQTIFLFRFMYIYSRFIANPPLPGGSAVNLLYMLYLFALRVYDAWVCESILYA